MEKRSKKNIAIANNVSPNTVERVIDSYYEMVKIYKITYLLFFLLMNLDLLNLLMVR